MKNKLMLVIVVGIAVLAVLYSQGYFTPSSPEQATIWTMDKGWNAITIPSSWPETTASALCSANPIIGMVTVGVSPDTVSYIPGTALPDIAITPGLELKVWVTGEGMLVSPEA